MAQTVIDGVTVVPGGGMPVIRDAAVVLDGLGTIVDIGDGAPSDDLFLVPAGMDLHLDNLVPRRRPRATVTLDHEAVITALDAECAAAGIATVCVAARCEHCPRKGIDIADAAVLAAAVEGLAPYLCCDWRIHARVELTDDGALDALQAVLAASSRVALISMIETTVERSRFSSLAETRRFYAQDWGVTEAEVEEVFRVDATRLAAVDDRRKQVAALAVQRGIALASHDDRTTEHIDEAFDFGARVAEFPLTMDAARRAHELGMHVVLGAPNALRGRSTSSGNVLAADAVSAGVCDVLCSDYLPSSLQSAPHALARHGSAPLSAGVDLISSNPAAVLGLGPRRIEVGGPLTASLRRIPPDAGGAHVGIALWRDGRLVFGRESPGFAIMATAG
ncbi:alpha-D-ribose 1-methylphosphonate 5-triphosphate diphosphatase [Mycolicibacterium elephantis]|uniref:alpha-D-ribose 1-methylphosphonate 5-triphosphate diphosphatase n=1 Tax=Mycolicibacterium elephantis TaxID=81858 RepID=UPI0007E99F8A|nr:alpha-D-ribose 1-methylphosphonate 5-triphosphate diphosphatase [Mycolicibacterium elephantis]OBA79316.1 alpha-D-ribose 1-methylphosphonate 5-triphosphate diphosphatase [Mycolicibacterium elephantis]